MSVSPQRAAIIDRTTKKLASRLAEVANVKAGSPELVALTKLSAEIVERVVAEVVPALTEQLLREQKRS